MKQQPRVESIEEFKLRIVAIIRAKPEHIPVHRDREKHNVVRQPIHARLRSPTAQRSLRRRSNFRRAAIQSAELALG